MKHSKFLLLVLCAMQCSALKTNAVEQVQDVEQEELDWEEQVELDEQAKQKALEAAYGDESSILNVFNNYVEITSKKKSTYDKLMTTQAQNDKIEYEALNKLESEELNNLKKALEFADDELLKKIVVQSVKNNYHEILKIIQGADLKDKLITCYSDKEFAKEVLKTVEKKRGPLQRDNITGFLRSFVSAAKTNGNSEIYVYVTKYGLMDLMPAHVRRDYAMAKANKEKIGTNSLELQTNKKPLNKDQINSQNWLYAIFQKELENSLPISTPLKLKNSERAPTLNKYLQSMPSQEMIDFVQKLDLLAENESPSFSEEVKKYIHVVEDEAKKLPDIDKKKELYNKDNALNALFFTIINQTNPLIGQTIGIGVTHQTALIIDPTGKHAGRKISMPPINQKKLETLERLIKLVAANEFGPDYTIRYPSLLFYADQMPFFFDAFKLIAKHMPKDEMAVMVQELDNESLFMRNKEFLITAYTKKQGEKQGEKQIFPDTDSDGEEENRKAPSISFKDNVIEESKE